MQKFRRTTEIIDYLRDLGVEERIKLKWILKMGLRIVVYLGQVIIHW